MKKPKTVEEDIEAFLHIWGCEELTAFLRDIIPLFELFDVSDESDWVTEIVGADDEANIRLIRTVYLLSRIADFHAGRLCNTNITHKRLWERMEKHGVGQ